MNEQKYLPMTIYKASAGSGKTFTLAIRYIELLINDPESYKKTLAVTFTNKATEEMKKRILSQLYGLANGLSDSKAYLERICEDLNVTENHVRTQAEIALSHMLHDYNFFNIETIDSFFQRVLRNLAREMGLNANLKVELNDKEIEQKAVDKLIANLKKDDPVLLWIINFAKERLADDKGWRVVDSIKEFGVKIFTDEYKEHAEALKERLTDIDFINDFKSQMRDIISKADNEMKLIGTEFFNRLSAAGISVGSFSGGKNDLCNYFARLRDGYYYGDKVANKTLEKALAGSEGWCTKAQVNANSPEYAFAKANQSFLIESEQKRQKHCITVPSAKVVLKHLNELRLLGNIKQMVDELNGDDNRFLLSDTQTLLNKMMVGSDAPFIFEKIGGPLFNIMIDEFQDTSTIQWDNFRPLVSECMGKGGKNLIVGDVKQSIYRWRNGDWNLLQNKLHQELPKSSIKDEPLKDNYRSEGNIIRFNNEFFIEAAKQDKAVLDDDKNDGTILTDIYSDDLVEQFIPEVKKEKDNGFVDIRLLDASTKKTDNETSDEPTFEQRVLILLKEQLDDLFALGATDESIGILARGNKELVVIADYLQNEYLDKHVFVSDEAYKLDASFAVNIIITAMHVLNHPDDVLTRAQLANLYQQKVLGHEVAEVEYYDRDKIDAALPHDFIDGDKQLLLLTKPLVDLAEELFNIFQLSNLSDEAAYIMAFYDQLGTFAQNHVPDIQLLLDYWNETMHSKTVKGGELSGIRLLTIHKSKGLEFDHVMIPFLDWEFDRFGSDLWCSTDEKPFNQMPVIPVNTKSLKGTIYDNQYREEQRQIFIDNMNMLYVAFTRASKSLHVIGKRPKTSTTKRSFAVMKTLEVLASSNKLQGIQYDCPEKEGDVHFTYGSPYVKAEKSKTSDNVFLQTPATLTVGIDQESSQLEFRQSNRSRRFVASTDDDAPTSRSVFASVGTILHNVLAKIESADDVERILDDFVEKGYLPDTSSTTDSTDGLNRESVSQMLKARIVDNKKNPQVNTWFSKDVAVFNECTIVGYDEREHIVREQRPDRVVCQDNHFVVIDYKFGKKHDEHSAQVRRYMQLLRDMHHDNVDGYIWYVYSNELVPVSFNA